MHLPAHFFDFEFHFQDLLFCIKSSLKENGNGRKYFVDELDIEHDKLGSDWLLESVYGVYFHDQSIDCSLHRSVLTTSPTVSFTDGQRNIAKQGYRAIRFFDAFGGNWLTEPIVAGAT